MKGYERTFRRCVPRRAYTLMRLDGRAFHTYLRGADKPYDVTFANDMEMVTLRLCEEIQGAKFAYTQSDEISLLLTDFDDLNSELWFGGNVSKMLSLSAAVASTYMYARRQWWGRVPLFDSRVWSMSDPVEVANYFLWRQQDATRNSIQAAGQRYFSPKELHGKSTGDIQEMLWTHHDINWSHYPDEFKRGRIVAPVVGEGWLAQAAPLFSANPNNILADLIPELPRLKGEGV